MAKPFVDISILGDKELAKKLAALEDKHQKAAVRSALAKSATRLKKASVAAAPVRTDFDGEGSPPGLLKAALKATKTKGGTKRDFIWRIWPLPPRELLGIPLEYKGGFWPTAVEYGHKNARGGGRTPPRPYIRSTVNSMQGAELTKIGKDIGKWIERKAAKG